MVDSQLRQFVAEGIELARNSRKTMCALRKTLTLNDIIPELMDLAPDSWELETKTDYFTEYTTQAFNPMRINLERFIPRNSQGADSRSGAKYKLILTLGRVGMDKRYGGRNVQPTIEMLYRIVERGILAAQ